NDAEDCLHVLLELYPLRAAGQVTLEHPKGEKIKIVGIGSSNDLSMKIIRERDWFGVEGSFQVNEEEILQFRTLLEHVQKTDSPFIQLDDGAFLALTDTFREQLLALDGMLSKKGNQFQLSTLMAPQMDALSEQLANIEADVAWQESLDRIRQAQQNGIFRSDINPVHVITIFVITLTHWFEAHPHHSQWAGIGSDEEFLDDFLHIFLDGLKPEHAPHP
ncbi:MAG: hypothetical protein AAGH65_02495, partial [Pseudomonadota bacterium]